MKVKRMKSKEKFFCVFWTLCSYITVKIGHKVSQIHFKIEIDQKMFCKCENHW